MIFDVVAVNQATLADATNTPKHATQTKNSTNRPSNEEDEQSVDQINGEDSRVRRTYAKHKDTGGKEEVLEHFEIPVLKLA